MMHRKLAVSKYYTKIRLLNREVVSEDILSRGS